MAGNRVETLPLAAHRRPADRCLVRDVLGQALKPLLEAVLVEKGGLLDQEIEHLVVHGLTDTNPPLEVALRSRIRDGHHPTFLACSAAIPRRGGSGSNAATTPTGRRPG